MPNTSFSILMADDDYEDLELVESAIASVNDHAHVYKVSDGKAAIRYLESQPDDKLPCLIILDYNMPELNGAEVLSRIQNKQRYAEIPKLILSTSSTTFHIQECKSKGATDYFVKPDNMHALTELAKKMLSYCSQSLGK